LPGLPGKFVIPIGNYVIEVGNNVSANRSTVGNYVSADI
jgi:hypothetical protein